MASTALFPQIKNADVRVCRALVGRGPWLLQRPRDRVYEPITFLVFTVKARVTAVWTNHRRRSPHVDVM